MLPYLGLEAPTTTGEPRSKGVRRLEGHEDRVCTLAWKGDTLTSGSRDKTIINHDGNATRVSAVGVRNSLIWRVQAHGYEVCGMKWSDTGNLLASGGNDNIVYIWEASKISSKHFLHRLKGHHGVVKALAWCPYDTNLLASAGGTMNGCIKVWNTRKGSCINSINTEAQVCGLQWNRHPKEILSGHRFSTRGLQFAWCS